MYAVPNKVSSETFSRENTPQSNGKQLKMHIYTGRQFPYTYIYTIIKTYKADFLLLFCC